MQIELQNFENGRRVTFQGPNNILQKIQKLKAENRYDQIVNMSYQLPEDLQIYMLRAIALLRLKSWNKLIQCCEKAISMYEEESQFYNLKGKALGKLGNLEQKIQLVKKAIKLNDTVPAYFRNLGAAYYLLQKYPHAIVNHTKAIQLQPDNAINYHNIGASYYRNQQIEQAYTFFKKAIDRNDKLSASYAWAGDCADKLGNKFEAFQNYSKAYEKSGNVVYAQQKIRLEKQIKANAKSNAQKNTKKKFLGIF